MTNAMNPHLFVYGTLLSTAAHPKGAQLRREARLVGPATFRGRLYRVSWYPALVEDPAGGEVHGEVYALNAPAASFTWLDAYESIVPDDPERSEYARVERSVRLASGQDVTTWVYLYRTRPPGLELIADGRWVPAEASRE